MLAYFVLPAILFLLVHPFDRNRFVRFHSYQCLFTVGALLAVHVCLASSGGSCRCWCCLCYGLLLLADLTLWLLLLVKAYQHEMFKLPFVGDLAEQLGNQE